jgi:transcriptional regulator with XRE-family HTH domain
MSDRAGQVDPRLRDLGHRLRLLREDADLTAEDLAERSGRGVRQILRVEAGRGSPSVVWLLDVAAALEVSPARLLET